MWWYEILPNCKCKEKSMWQCGCCVSSGVGSKNEWKRKRGATWLDTFFVRFLSAKNLKIWGRQMKNLVHEE